MTINLQNIIHKINIPLNIMAGSLIQAISTTEESP